MVPVVLRPVVTVDCGGLCLMDALLQVHDVLEAWGCTYNNFAIRGRYLSLVGLTKAQVTDTALSHVQVVHASQQRRERRAPGSSFPA